MHASVWSQRFSFALRTESENGDWLSAPRDLAFRQETVAAGCLSPFSDRQP